MNNLNITNILELSNQDREIVRLITFFLEEQKYELEAEIKKMHSALYDQHASVPAEVPEELPVPEEFVGGTPMKKSEKINFAEPTTHELRQYSEKLKVSCFVDTES